MTDPGDARCPGCGAAVVSRYCPHCGARTGWSDLVPAGPPVPGERSVPAEPSSGSAEPSSGSAEPSTVYVDTPTEYVEPITVPMPAVSSPVPVRAVPEMFSTEFLPVRGPAQAWSQAADSQAPPAGPPSGLFPGWTGMHPAVSAGSPALAPRPERRRRAVSAVLAIAAVTVVVLLAALLIGRTWRTGGTAGAVADKVGTGTAVGTAAPSGTAAGTRAGSTAAATSPTGVPTGPTAPGGAGDAPVRTVTVTASTGAASTGTATVGARPTASTRPTPTPRPTPPASPEPSTRPSPRPAVTPPLGVPQRDIACSSGYIVQLASELDQPRFKARVAALKAAGQVPAGALAADSTRSCRLFTSQVNTLVLYAGPFRSRYDGCAARLQGPADAFIKGGNADSAGEFVSCLCPWSAAALPRYAAIGQQGVWVGELQRMLGNRLNVDIADLTGNWGRFTAGTQAAVRKFQQAAGLPGNGVVDARTWRALQSAGC